MGISNVIFFVCLLAASIFFALQIKRIRRNIALGRDLPIQDSKAERWKTMIRVALGQSKMVRRPIAGLLHILVYVGFVLINIEVMEFVIDGLVGTHRVLAFMGPLYDVMIASFEVLALLVLVSCLIFLVRRNVMRIARFHYREMKKWPKSDANLILVAEVLLMSALFLMNTSDAILQARGAEHYTVAGSFPISQYLVPFFEHMSDASLILLERGTWWFHIIGILLFLNYLPISKHFHIVLAFPNVFYSNLKPKGQFSNMEAVTNEVKMMFDPSADPYAAPAPAEEGAVPQRFGAKDVTDLSWKSILDAYTCTECGRCSSECPANQTGKLLSPRAIMMATRDRADELGKVKAKGGADAVDEKFLLRDYISEEEVWACTSCNACVDACPVNIDPLTIILDLRRFLVMEESKMPGELASMFTNIENNGAPWQFAPQDRLKWAEEA